eukprot:1497245-Pyramimonas_sp.AAC.2
MPPRAQGSRPRQPGASPEPQAPPPWASTGPPTHEPTPEGARFLQPLPLQHEQSNPRVAATAVAAAPSSDGAAAVTVPAAPTGRWTLATP